MSGYILLVDDDQQNLMVLKTILQQEGYQLKLVSSGQQALTQVASQVPELVLMDVNMPEMSGFEVCRQLKADPRFHQVPVIFISANIDIEHKLEGFKAGAVDYITKPFQPEEVVVRVSSQLLIQKQRRQLESVLNSSQDGIVAFESVRQDAEIVDFKCLLLNRKALEMGQKTSQEFVGALLLEQFPFIKTTGIFQDFVSVVDSGEPLSQEVHFASLQRWFQWTGVKLDDGLVVTFRDITVRKEMELQLAQLAEQDGLTGIANRRVFDDSLHNEWKRCARSEKPLSLILCDIDYFKQFNDTFGHISGDQALIKVAQAIQNSVRRPGDLVARYGGEEFVVILPETEPEGALVIAQKIAAAVKALRLPSAIKSHSETLTLSMGLASQVPEFHESESQLLAEADDALYQAKAAGRNRMQLFDTLIVLDSL